MGRNIDNAAEPARDHAVQCRLDQRDRCRMLPSSALIQSSRSNLRKSPGGGPPALLMRMSGAGQAARMASRPSLVVTSAMTALGRLPVADAISSTRALQHFAPSRGDDEMNARAREGHGAGLAKPLTCRAYDRRAAHQSQIHV